MTKYRAKFQQIAFFPYIISYQAGKWKTAKNINVHILSIICELFCNVIYAKHANLPLR